MNRRALLGRSAPAAAALATSARGAGRKPSIIVSGPWYRHYLGLAP